jgi:hypothetical protein
MIKWLLLIRNLVLNLDKKNVMKFITKNSSHITLHIGYKEKCTEDKVLQIDNIRGRSENFSARP